MENGENYKALWPGGPLGIKPIPPATRENLKNKRIAFLWDNVFRGEEIFPILEENLSKQFADIEFIDYQCFGSIFGSNEHAVLLALPKRLKELEINAVISGVGC